MIRLVGSILLFLLAAACVLFGILYFAGLGANFADKYGPSGKVISIVVMVLAMPIFNLGRFVARRRRPPASPP